ncbi:acyltransferase family protein [Bacteroidota bacterium]
MKDRIISLDVFRGFTIIGMIIVNSPGSWSYIYPPLRHAEWDGLTITDLVFPFFLFIVGVSLVLSYTKKIEKGIPKKELVWKATKRALIIFCLGIILNLISYQFKELRLMGVLQRIAVVFYICTFLFLYISQKYQLIIGGTLLILYWIVISTIPSPGIELDLSVPGKNLTVFFDSFLPGKLYFETWDPEGLLSTFPAIVTTISGMIAGYIIISKKVREMKNIWMYSIGFTAMIVGYIWSLFFPFNKSIWSSSYVLFSSGLAFLTLSVLMWLIDGLKFDKFARIPIIFGSNAITVYVIHGILYIPLSYISIGKTVGIQSGLMNILTSIGFVNELASLTWAIIYTGLCFIPILVLYRYKIFIKV